MDVTQRLEEARAAARVWSGSKPRTAKRNQAAAEAIAAYVALDALLSQGMALPGPWATVALPTAEEVAEALTLVGMMMPIESSPVLVIARKVVEVMGRRRSPQKPTHPDWV